MVQIIAIHHVDFSLEIQCFYGFADTALSLPTNCDNYLHLLALSKYQVMNTSGLSGVLLIDYPSNLTGDHQADVLHVK